MNEGIIFSDESGIDSTNRYGCICTVFSTRENMVQLHYQLKQISCYKEVKGQIKKALKVKTELEITNAFLPYIDQVLKEQVTINKILPYFFAFKNEEYEIIDNYLDYYNIHYGYEKH